MTNYNVGDILIAKEDVELEDKASKRFTTLKKGTKGWVALNEPLIVLWEDGNYQTFVFDDKEQSPDLVGFNVFGIADMIYWHLSNKYSMDKIIENNGITRNDFITEIAEALNMLGMYEEDRNKDKQGE